MLIQKGKTHNTRARVTDRSHTTRNANNKRDSLPIKDPRGVGHTIYVILVLIHQIESFCLIQ